MSFDNSLSLLFSFFSRHSDDLHRRTFSSYATGHPSHSKHTLICRIHPRWKGVYEPVSPWPLRDCKPFLSVNIGLCDSRHHDQLSSVRNQIPSTCSSYQFDILQYPSAVCVFDSLPDIRRPVLVSIHSIGIYDVELKTIDVDHPIIELSYDRWKKQPSLLRRYRINEEVAESIVPDSFMSVPKMSLYFPLPYRQSKLILKEMRETVAFFVDPRVSSPYQNFFIRKSPASLCFDPAIRICSQVKIVLQKDSEFKLFLTPSKQNESFQLFVCDVIFSLRQSLHLESISKHFPEAYSKAQQLYTNPISHDSYTICLRAKEELQLDPLQCFYLSHLMYREERESVYSDFVSITMNDGSLLSLQRDKQLKQIRYDQTPSQVTFGCCIIPHHSILVGVALIALSPTIHIEINPDVQLKRTRATLVVASPSQLLQWRYYLNERTPYLNILMIENRSIYRNVIEEDVCSNYDVVLISDHVLSFFTSQIDTLLPLSTTFQDVHSSRSSLFERIVWNRVIVDEAHTYKHVSHQRSKAVLRLISSRRIALSSKECDVDFLCTFFDTTPSLVEWSTLTIQPPKTNMEYKKLDWRRKDHSDLYSKWYKRFMDKKESKEIYQTIVIPLLLRFLSTGKFPEMEIEERIELYSKEQTVLSKKRPLETEEKEQQHKQYRDCFSGKCPVCFQGDDDWFYETEHQRAWIQTQCGHILCSSCYYSVANNPISYVCIICRQHQKNLLDVYRFQSKKQISQRLTTSSSSSSSFFSMYSSKIIYLLLWARENPNEKAICYVQSSEMRIEIIKACCENGIEVTENKGNIQTARIIILSYKECFSSSCLHSIFFMEYCPDYSLIKDKIDHPFTILIMKDTFEEKLWNYLIEKKKDGTKELLF